MELTPADVAFLKQTKIAPFDQDEDLTVHMSIESFRTLYRSLTQQTEAANQYRASALSWRARALQTYGVLMVVVTIELIRFLWK